MGDAQSAQREAKSDAAAEKEEEERGKVSDAETEQNIDDEVLRKNEQISEINRKADSAIAASNGLCEDEIAVEDADASEPLKEEETPAENDQIILKELPDEADPPGSEEMIEMDAKQNDINESFRKIFSNISLKLTVKRGSTDKDEIRHEPEEEPNQTKDIKDASNEIIGKAQQEAAQETGDNDSTTYKTLTDNTSPDFVEKTDNKTSDTREEDGGTTSPASEEATPEEEVCLTSPTSPDGKEITTQFKRFFTTGIFSSFRKRRSLVDDKITGKELLDMDKNVAAEPVNQDQQQHEEENVSPGVEGTTAENLTDEAKPPSIVVDEILDSQEKNKVQASPLKRLMSSSSFKKLSKKQRGRKSSESKLSDSGEHSSDQLLSSTESADNQKEETSTQPFASAAGGEEGAWASFKKLMTPQKRVKRPSVDNEEGQIQGLEGEQVSDQSTEEGKKRKDSSVSWEAVLCGSGRRRSRKTSDSDDETPQRNNEDRKRDSGPKETFLGTSEEQRILASSPKQKGSPPEGDEGSTWQSFKKLVTPKRKVKDEDEISSEAQDDSSFSIKKLLPGKRDRKSAERQDQASSDEADKEVASGDEDSETPAVVPLSEFDPAETSVQMQTQADLERYTEKEDELQEDVADKKTEAVLIHDEAKEIPKSEQMLESEEQEELSESISNHQQLSDIPEEGVLTEHSPASIAEEAARDETIAEDLNEITSEAITAPEPVDATQADETEMISAVSQLTDSSKTSGNTTPVPAEYSVMDTGELLQQVSQTISVNPAEVLVYSEEPSSENVVYSISHQILTSSATDQPKLLEIHRGSEATALKTGLNTEEIEAVKELAATTQTENISQLSEALSTEIVSEVSTEEFDTAEPAADEVYEISVSELQENIKELEISNTRQHVEEGVSDLSTEKTPKEVVRVQVEKDTLKTDPREEAVFKSADETEDVAGETGVQSPAEEAETFVSEQDEKSLPVLDDLDELETLTAEAVVLTMEESLEEQLSEDIRPTETDKEEPKQTEHLTKVTDEPEETEPETTGAKSDQSEEVSDGLQAPTLELDKNVVLSIKEASVFENTASAEIKQLELRDEITDEPEDKEPQTDGAKSEQSEEEAEGLQDPTLEPEVGVVLLVKNEVSENVASAEKDETSQVELSDEITDEPEVKEPQPDGAKSEEPDVLQGPTLEPEEGGVSSIKKEALVLEDIAAEKDTDETKQAEFIDKITDGPENRESAANEDKTDHLEVIEKPEAPVLEFIKDAVQSSNKEESFSERISAAQVDTDNQKQLESLTEETAEPENKETQISGAKIDQDKVKGVLQVVQAPTSESQEDVPFSDSTSSADTDEQKRLKSLTEETIESEMMELQMDGAKIEQEVVEAPALESQEDGGLYKDGMVSGVDSLTDKPEHKEPQTDGAKDAKVDTDGLKQEEELIKVPDEPESTDLHAAGAGSDHAEATKVLEVIQTFTLESQDDVIKSFSTEITPSESISLTEVDKEQKQVKSFGEVTEEQGNREHQADAPKTEHHEDTENPEVKEGPNVVQEARLKSEESKDQPPEKEVISGDEVPPAEPEPTDEPESLTEVNVEVEDGPKSEDVEEPEAAVAPMLPSESGRPEASQEDVKPDGTPSVETSTDDPKQTTEVQTESEESVDSEASSPTVKEITKTDVETSQPPASQHDEEIEKQTILEGVQLEESDIITEETETQCVSQLHQESDINKDQETESVPCDAQVEQEENLPEVAEELQALAAVHVSSVNEEPGSAPVLETTICPEKTTEPCAEKTEVCHEPIHEVKPCELQEIIEVEKADELPDAEQKVAASGQAVITYKVTQNLKDVSPEKPNALVQEPLISRILSETEFNDTVETAALLVRDDINETAEEGSVVVMLHLPSVEMEANHRIQVQVVDVDIRSAENKVDTVIEVGVTEDKEVIDVCHESIEEVENFSATHDIEEDKITEEIKVTVQEVMQHVKSDLPERAAESVEQLDVTKGSEMNQNNSNEAEAQPIKDESVMERRDEGAVAFICNGSITDQQDSEDHEQTSSISESLDISIHDHKDESEETKGDLEKYDATEKTPTIKDVTMEAQGLPTTQNQIATHSSAGLASSQNTGVITSTGNLESPSSLSLEFKLNIQFGQSKVQTPPSPSTERTEPMKPAETSEAAVQAASLEPKPQSGATQTSESEKQAELNVFAANATEMTEPATQRAVIASWPVLQSAANQAEEQIQSTDGENPDDQAAERERQTEEREIHSETRAEEPLEQTEENDQDVWLDAEEDIKTLEETQKSTDTLDEPVETRSKLKGAEPEMVCDDEGLRDAQKTTGTYENESEGEDFAVALEDLETSSPAVE